MPDITAALALITTLSDAEQAIADAMARLDAIRTSEVTSDQALRTAISQRVATLRREATDAQTFATSETTRATTVAGYPVSAITPAAIQAEFVTVHNDIASLAATISAALGDIADLATVVGNNL